MNMYAVIPVFGLLWSVCCAIRLSECASDVPLTVSGAGGVSTSSSIVSHSFNDMSNVEVTVELAHTHLADVIIKITLEEAYKTVTLLNQLSGSRADGVDAIFSDSGSAVVDKDNVDDGIKVKGQQALSVFNNVAKSTQNTWKLSIEDTYPAADDGTLTKFCISYEVPTKYGTVDTTGKDYCTGRQLCTNEYGTDLAVMRTEDDRILARETCKAACDALGHACKGCFFGLNDLVTESNYQWIDGSSPASYDWGTAQPDNNQNQEDCADMWKDIGYKWNDVRCWAGSRIPLCDVSANGM